ncbi:MAG: hypothetical protein JRG97_01030 [Deltaproteobacteria bacterium]|nr:hypothetical protein [Deltaproteobacteria bacterium]MBW2050968.1 hypothetical protein [Deltaproteobacteria bacterium]MBW2139639.1 hypothetical protein [Deltaproteobacteria bacterium]MBW2322249.1 hypothetical protein [Deltaproteobacteria bacterium]
MEREDLKQRVFDLVAQSQKKVKPTDLARTLARSVGVDKKEVKEAITNLVSEGKLIYTYIGHTWLELPSDKE